MTGIKDQADVAQLVEQPIRNRLRINDLQCFQYVTVCYSAYSVHQCVAVCSFNAMGYAMKIMTVSWG